MAAIKLIATLLVIFTGVAWSQLAQINIQSYDDGYFRGNLLGYQGGPSFTTQVTSFKDSGASPTVILISSNFIGLWQIIATFSDSNSISMNAPNIEQLIDVGIAFFEQGEIFTSFSATYLPFPGYISITSITFATTKQATKTYGLATSFSYNFPVYSGILAGFGYMSRPNGYSLNGFGPIFLRNVVQSRITDLYAPSLTYVNVPLEVVKEQIIDNTAGTIPIAAQFSYSVTTQTTSTYTVANSWNIGGSLSVSAGFSLISDVTTTFTWGVSQTTTSSMSSSVTYTDSNTISINVAPGTSVHYVATRYRGSLENYPFTASMYFLLDNGNNVQYSVTGTYSGVQFTRSVVTSV